MTVLGQIETPPEGHFNIVINCPGSAFDLSSSFHPVSTYHGLSSLSAPESKVR